jgi:hypothetical protein
MVYRKDLRDLLSFSSFLLQRWSDPPKYHKFQVDLNLV